MPWHIGRSTSCPNGKPFAVITDGSRKVVGCHETRGKAQAHMRALYANVPEAGGSGRDGRVHLVDGTVPIGTGMPADDVLRQLRDLHDQLVANQPAGAAHDAAVCAHCQEGASVSGKTYSEAELQAAVAAAASSAVADLRTQLDELRASQEAAAVEDRVASAVAEATAPLRAQVEELEKSLDAAKIEAANEKARADGLQAANEQAAREAAIAGRRDSRLERVKEAAPHLDEEYLKANAERWAAMEDEAFEERVAEYAVLSKKTTPTLPTATALSAAVHDTGTPKPAPARTSATKDLHALRRQGVDVRTI